MVLKKKFFLDDHIFMWIKQRYTYKSNWRSKSEEVNKYRRNMKEEIDETKNRTKYWKQKIVMGTAKNNSNFWE